MLFIVLVYLVYIKVIAMGGAFETRHTLLCRANIMQGERNGKEKAFFLSISARLALTLALNEATINLKKGSIVARTA